MNINIVKLKQYNSTYKYLVMVDGKPICITKGGKRASECVQYINGYNADINDGVIKKILDKYRMPSINKDTEMKKKREKKHKTVHEFNENSI